MALSKTQSLVLKLLSSSPLRDRFYWTGGTLLAERYLNHRHSYDVDLFSDNEFKYEEILPFIRVLKEKSKLEFVEEKKVFDRWEFFLHNGKEARVEFVHYDFPALKPRRRLNGILIDSLEDLAANKTMAVVERHEPKDTVDMYFLITKKKFTLKKLLRLAHKKFGFKMDESTLLGQIMLGGRRLSDIKPILHGTTAEQQKLIEAIQKYFNTLSADYLRRRLSY